MPLSTRESVQPIVMEEAPEKQSGFDLRSSLWMLLWLVAGEGGGGVIEVFAAGKSHSCAPGAVAPPLTSRLRGLPSLFLL